MKILLWHVHGSYLTALNQGNHEYLIPTLADRGPYGAGRSATWEWPPSTKEVTPGDEALSDVDLVILQRPEEFDLAQIWLNGRRPGTDVPCIYLEHNCPKGSITTGNAGFGTRDTLGFEHPFANRDDVTIVHCTHFNRLYWNTGSTRTKVVEHGVIDPGHRYTGEIGRAAVVINEPVRRGRIVGTDVALLLAERSGVGLDWFGFDTQELGGIDIPQGEVHDHMPKRRVYVHPHRWTSLGLTLIEAMMLGMPVVALATTEVADMLPRDVGVISNDLDLLVAGLRRLDSDPEFARRCGDEGRRFATERFGVKRFLADWDEVMKEVTHG